MPKKMENLLKQCEKCECLILPDASGHDSKCFNPKMIINKTCESLNSSGEGILISPNCHETIKIYVKGHCNDEKSSYAETSITGLANGEDCKMSQTEPRKSLTKGSLTKSDVVKPEVVKPEVVKPEVVKPEAAKPETVSDDESRKFNCWGLCRRKKKKKASPQKQEKVEEQKPDVTKDQHQVSEIAVGDNLIPKQRAASANTDIVLLPRDKSSGDALASLENIIKIEAKMNRMNLEDILNELHRQKRDLNEIKDMLDCVSRAVREQLFITTFGKGKNELLEELNRKNNLERKNNSLSISKTGGSAVYKPPKNGGPSKKETKKKRFFLWCKS